MAAGAIVIFETKQEKEIGSCSARADGFQPDDVNRVARGSMSAAGALDWTETTFDAAHKGEYAEQIHGHTWHVRVWWPASPPKDARFMHARLRQYLEAAFDHRLLDDVIPDPTNYGVAKALLQFMGDDIKTIEVWRGGAMPCGVRIDQ